MDEASETLASDPRAACADSFGTWFVKFGLRGLACIAGHAVSPVEIVARAGVDVFVESPHTVNGESFSLNLTSERDFGRYNPDFVDWVVENGVVGAKGSALLAVTQPIYDAYIKRLARAYYLTYENMAADGYPQATPEGISSDYASFLEGGAIPAGAESNEGGFSMMAFVDTSESLLSQLDMPVANEWEAKYELNTAFGFWVRRRADGTQQHWHDGLVRLLETYDGAWLAAR